MLHFIRLCLKLLGSRFDLFDALCWIRKFLRHSPSQLSNGIADFFTHLKVHWVRRMRKAFWIHKIDALSAPTGNPVRD